MKANIKHSGVIVPLTTPFTAEGAIDLAAAERIVQRIARHNLGVFVLGTTGETASIPRQDRQQLVEAAVKAAAGKVPVYAGIGDNCLANSLIAAQRYHDIGVPALVAHLPAYYPLTDDEMRDYFLLLDARLTGPYMIYNIPATTRMSIPPDVVADLAGQPLCVGFKDSENAPGRMETVYETLGGRENFSLFMGSAILSVAAMKLGYDGLVPSSGNLVPQLWEDLYSACLSGAWETAESLQKQLDEVSAVIQNDRTLGQSLAALKAAMAGIGLCRSDVLPPLQTLGLPEAEEIKNGIFALCPFLADEQEVIHGTGR